MNELRYHKGDLFEFVTCGDTILHVCNNQGGWGAGFVIPLAERYPRTREVYMEEYTGFGSLGTIQLVHNGYGNPMVVNLIAQDGFPSINRRRALSYDALCICFEKVVTHCAPCRIVMPKIGAGIAGGNWRIIETMIQEILLPKFDIVVCTLK